MIWNKSDVKEGVKYRLHLCQSSDRRRTLKLVVVGSDSDLKPTDDVFLVTEIVPYDLLCDRNLNAIAKQVMLTNGERFSVDAHGIWCSALEVEDYMTNVSESETRWISGAPPVMPPR